MVPEIFVAAFLLLLGPTHGDALRFCINLSPPEHGTVSYSEGSEALMPGSRIVETVAIIRCNAGPYTNNWIRKCQVDGRWTDDYEEPPKCPLQGPTEKVSCPDLTEIPNAVIKYSSPKKKVHSMATITCKAGFRGLQPSGVKKRLCQSDGTWSDEFGEWTSISAILVGTPSCDEIKCQDLGRGPPIFNVQLRFYTSDGKLIKTDGRKSIGTVAKYTCRDPDQVLVEGATTRTCTDNGGWSGSGSSPVCARSSVTCPTLKKNLGDGIIFDRGLKPYDGTVVYYGCFDGHTLVDSDSNPLSKDSRTCQPDGTWSGEDATCKLTSVICPKLNAPVNGWVIYKWKIFEFLYGAVGRYLLVGTVGNYSCKQGYTLVGESKRTCQSDGTWNGNEASCQPKLESEIQSLLLQMLLDKNLLD